MTTPLVARDPEVVSDEGRASTEGVGLHAHGVSDGASWIREDRVSGTWAGMRCPPSMTNGRDRWVGHCVRRVLDWCRARSRVPARMLPTTTTYSIPRSPSISTSTGNISTYPNHPHITLPDRHLYLNQGQDSARRQRRRRKRVLRELCGGGGSGGGGGGPAVEKRCHSASFVGTASAGQGRARSGAAVDGIASTSSLLIRARESSMSLPRMWLLFEKGLLHCDPIGRHVGGHELNEGEDIVWLAVTRSFARIARAVHDVDGEETRAAERISICGELVGEGPVVAVVVASKMLIIHRRKLAAAD
ncbi:hypothetical protein DFP72DRAFT_860771 [Ephemerocybe angulata]|uniref:Uncharacterized protein n=1 Tax=Ephemerocybe angulata TaxID=980116 RepID=A0A8H6H8A2_9AGAR|nr:hypothetical protein DFP72DRAFT_860764 [Tulosesus angulatus]KAF6742250.1 hypothetical protein DFP72DRAFT_860771 [Tulosesus angulatus]